MSSKEKKLKQIKDYENVNLINAHTTNFIRYINSVPIDERIAYEVRVEKEPIRYDDCLSIMDVGRKLNDLYVAFMKDYDALPVKLDLGDELDIVYYREGEDYEGKFSRTVELFVYRNNQIDGNRSSAEFLIMEHDGEIKNALTNKHLQCASRYEEFYNRLSIDEKVLESYLDLFQKHQDFINTFSNPDTPSLSDQTWVMMELFKDRDLDITNGLKKLQIHGYLSDSYNFIFDINFKLGEDFGIDFAETKFMVNDSVVKFTKEDITSFANSIFINKYYLSVGVNGRWLYEEYDIYDPKVQYKYCVFNEKLNDKYGKKFSHYEITNILKEMINVYSEPIKLYQKHTNCEKITFQENIKALFAIESYDNVIENYDKTLNKESSTRKRKDD